METPAGKVTISKKKATATSEKNPQEARSLARSNQHGQPDRQSCLRLSPVASASPRALYWNWRYLKAKLKWATKRRTVGPRPQPLLTSSSFTMR